MLIRSAGANDDAAIFAVHCAAFGGDAETRLVRMLDRDGDALVSLVAEKDGVVVGHVMFSQMNVEADGEAVPGAGLAPLGVLPAFQSSGIGTALVHEGLARLPAFGIRISFVLGHPRYYPRFGYRPEHAEPFASPYAGPHFMALLLDKSGRLPERGRADYAPAFARLG
jgi:putative acetyltransferase